MLTINPKITFNGEEAREGILDPAFSRPELTRIMRIRENIKAKTQIAFLGRIEKVTKLDGGCGTGKDTGTLPMEEKFWDPVRMKIWFQQCGDDVEDTFFVWGAGQGLDRKDLTTNPQYWMQWVMETFEEAALDDCIRVFFFGDTAIDDIGSGGTLTLAADIVNYNQLDGIFNQIFADVTAGDTPRFQIDENFGAFATGSSEITVFANLVSGADDTIDVDGSVFTAQAAAVTPGDLTFQAASSNEDTANSLKNQINAHATASTVVVASIDVTNPANVLLKSIVAGIAGNAVTLVYTDNDANVGATVSGATLTGGFEANFDSQANLAAGRAKEIYRAVYNQSDARLKQAQNKVYLVSGSLFDNRIDEKEDLANSGLESGLSKQDSGAGFQEDVYKGIPVMNMENVWDRHITADFNNGVSFDIPNRVILTTIDNIVGGYDAFASKSEFKSFFDEETELTNLKARYTVDVKVMRPFLVSIGF